MTKGIQVQAVRQIIARARRRSFYQLWLKYVGSAIAWALVIAVLLLVITRAFAINVGWPVYLATGGLLIIAYTFLAWVRLPDAMAIAKTLDRRLDTKDRLASALHASKLGDDGFARAVIADANDLARKTDVRRALPLHMTRSWYSAGVAAMMFAVVFIFLPDDIDLLGQLAAARQKQAEQRAAEQAKQQIDSAVKIIAAKPSAAGDQQSIDEAISELERLSSEGLNDPTTRKQAAAKVSQVRDELQMQSQDKQQELQSLRNKLSQLDREVKGPADEFSDALRRGQFDDANDMLRQVIERVEQMSPAEQQALRRQMKNLARQLIEQQQQQQEKKQQEITEAQPANEQPTEPDKSPSFAEKWMKRFGDSVRKMNEAAKQQEQAKQQEEKPKQPEPKPQSPEQPAEPEKQKSAEKSETKEQPKPEKRQRQGSPPPFMPQQGEPSQSPQQQPAQPESQPQPDEKQSKNQQPQHDGSDPSSPQQGQKQPQQQQGQQSEKQSETGEKQNTQQQSQKQPGNQPNQQQQPGQKPSQDQTQPDKPQQDQPFSEQQREQMKKIIEQMQPGDNPGQQQPQPQQFTPEQIEQIKDIAEQMQDQLSELSEMQQQLDQLKNNDKQLQDLMRQLSETSPDRRPDGPGDQPGGDPLGQPHRMSDYQKQMSRETSNASGQPVSSWLSDRPVEAGRSDATYEQSVKQARDNAERALTDDQLPSRYHPAVKQYFEQLPENLDQTNSKQTTEP